MKRHERLAEATAPDGTQLTLIRHDGGKSRIARALGSDFKGRISVVIYAVAIPLSFVNRWVAVALYAAVAAMWLVPDRRIERQIAE